MVSRTVKNILKLAFQKSKPEDIKSVAASILNDCFAIKKGITFRKEKLLPTLLQYFPQALGEEEEEEDPNFDILSYISLPFVIHRLNEFKIIRTRSTVLGTITAIGKSIVFSPESFDNFEPSQHSLHDLWYQKACSLIPREAQVKFLLF